MDVADTSVGLKHMQRLLFLDYLALTIKSLLVISTETRGGLSILLVLICLGLAERVAFFPPYIFCTSLDFQVVFTSHTKVPYLSAYSCHEFLFAIQRSGYTCS